MNKVILNVTVQVANLLSGGATAVRRSRHARYMREEYSCRRKRVNCALSHEEYRILQDAAQRYGLRPTSLLQKAALAHLRGAKLPTQQQVNMQNELLRQLHSIGCNLNQVARHCNRTQKLSWKGLKVLQVMIRDLIEKQSRFHEIMET